MRFLCRVKYDGSNYQGYQIQPNQNTIQSQIENCLKIICKEDIKIQASGRTDAKVHALGQMFHFDTSLNIAPLSFKKALNSLLPKDIEILDCYEVEDDFHARFNVIKKEYIYKINLGAYDLFERNYVTQLNSNIDLDLLEAASKLFIGKHDYRNFCSNKEEHTNYQEEIYRIDLSREENILTISFLATGFKRYMIRMMVGTLLEIAKGKIDSSYILERLDKEERNITHFNALPNGLYLKKVYYGRNEIDED